MIDWLTAGNEAIAAIAGDVAKFRRRRRSLPFIPYESLDPVPRHLSPDFRDLLEQRLTGAFALGPHSIPSIVEPIDWPAQVRPFALHLDSWEPISELLMGHAIFDEDRYFAAALTFARGWMDSFLDASIAIGPDPVALDAAFGPMRWFDMSVGQRIYRLAYIADVMARDPRYGDTNVLEAMRNLVFHCQLLSVEAFYQGHNNHGFYQAIGELAACRRFSKLPFFRQRHACAVRRVRASIKQQFFPSGIHREHSPGYHLMVLGTLNGARESGLLAFGAIDEHVAACEEALSWLVQPGGMIVTFGDSDPRAVNRGKYPPAMFRHPGLQYHVSTGTTGEVPEPGIRVYKNEGYVFARSGPPGSGGTKWWYLAQMASFQSRIHKHADDLSFVWSDFGRQILIDPGGFGRAKKTQKDSELANLGFWYAGTERVYVESTKAHNTVEIDGRSFDRRRKPFGSALKYAGEQNGLIVMECAVRQFDDIWHWRALVMSPGRFLLVIDRLKDRGGRPHDLRQLFHFHPDWEVEEHDGGDGGSVILGHPRTSRRVAVVSLTPDVPAIETVRGQTEPEMLGWYSNKAWSLIPSTSLALRQEQVADAVFATLLTFDVDAVPDPDRTRIRRSMRPSVLAWMTGRKRHRYMVSRGDGDEPVTVTRLNPRVGS